MANLETLTLEINGNAASAAQGINTLVTSLSALGAAVDAQAGKLKSFSDALKDISESSSKLKVGNIGKAIEETTKGVKNSAKAASDAVKEAVEVPKTKIDALQMKYSAVSDAMEKAAEKGNALSTSTKRLQMFSIAKQIEKEESAVKKVTSEMQKAVDMAKEDVTIPREIPYKKYGMTENRWDSMTQAEQKAFEKSVRLSYHMEQEQIKAANEAKRATTAMTEYAKAVDNTAKVSDKAAKGTNELSRASKEVAKTTPSIKQANHATTGLWKTIGRIAKTMLIRTAIRALMKLAKQGLQNFYQYSKSINSSYATAINKLGVGTTKAGNQLGAAIGTLLATVAPVLNAIISLVTAAVSALTAFFSLLGGGTTFTAATDGMNAFAQAAGGGGSAMKELLADFDEFNIIAQEGGGGGGGGGGAFSFAEMPIPRWMEEWKPLLEAIFWGTIGATILPAIAKILGDIISLFTGTGAGNLLTILKYLFTDKIPKFPDIPDIPDKQFPVQPDYKPFPTQPDYKAFPIQPAYTPFPVAPDYAKTAAEMVTLSAAANAALPAVQGIATALTAIGGAQLLMNAITTLLTKLAGATMKIKVDREEFDKFKKEVEEWTKKIDDHHINIRVNDAEFKVTSAIVDVWAKTPAYKNIYTLWFAHEFNVAASIIDLWASTPAYKKITTLWDSGSFNVAATIIDTWANTIAYKRVVTWWDASSFNIGVSTIDVWTNAVAWKMIYVSWVSTTFNAIVSIIDAWANTPVYKYIYTWWQADAFNVGAQVIDLWSKEPVFKKVYVTVDQSYFNIFQAVATMIDAWARETLTKTINVVINETKKPVTSNAAAVGANGVVGGLGSTISNAADQFLYDITHFNIFGEQGQQNNLGNILEFLGVDIPKKASGAYGIPNGDLFIANEAGAELVGSMNGRTTVANQGQIIEGIQRGVAEANESQNALLRQQNDLLRGILEKEMNVNLGASASFGRTVRQSLDMYNGMTGSR